MTAAGITETEADMPERVLVIEDVPADFRLLQRHLQKHGMGAACRHAPGPEAVDEALREGGWQLVLADHQLPGIDFDALLLRLRRELPDAPVILVTGTIGEEMAVDLLHQGVADFVLKDRMARLVPAIRRCIEDVRRRRAVAAAAQALADSEAFNRAVIASLADGLFVAQDGRFAYCNPALPAMLGHDPATFVGRRFEDVIAPAFLPVWNERYAQRVSTGLPEPERRYEVVFIHRDGREVWMDLRAVRFEFHGRPAVLGLLRDMTERYRVAAELERHRHHLEALVEERTKKAEAANRAKSAFLANMSHEIRTPVNAITGMVHLLQREAADAPQRDRLAMIADAARHLLGLVDDVLDLSKIESGKLTLERIPFDLGALLARTCALVAGKAAEKGLALHVDNAAEGAWLLGDPTRLSQLLLNLLGNAVKFTDAGSVRVSCRLEAGEPAQVLTLAVADTGIGIPAERLQQLFSAFEQADNSMTRRYGGSGLGLAISRHLAELMAGRIEVCSTPGQGSEFRFIAPFVPCAPAAGEPAPPSARALPAVAVPGAEQLLREACAGSRVLLAEDNAVNQIVACEMLQAAGLLVDVVDNGRLAVEKAQHVRYAAILLDMQMPDMDGLEAARALRRLPGLQQVPILAMTANAFNEDRDACLAAGMNDHIAKPVVAERLYALLLAWMQAPALRGGGRRA